MATNPIRFNDATPLRRGQRRYVGRFRDGPVRLWMDTNAHRYEILYMISGARLLFCDEMVVDELPDTAATRRLLAADSALGHLLRATQASPATPQEKRDREELLRQILEGVKAINDGA